MDSGFLSTSVGDLYQNALNMLMLLLPGAAVTYMGEELALSDLSSHQLNQLDKVKVRSLETHPSV